MTLFYLLRIMYHKSQLRYKRMPVVIECLQIGQKVYRAAQLSKLQVYDWSIFMAQYSIET